MSQQVISHATRADVNKRPQTLMKSPAPDSVSESEVDCRTEELASVTGACWAGRSRASENHRMKQSRRRKLRLFVAAAVMALWCVSCEPLPNRIVSEGSRVGVVTKFSLKEANPQDFQSSPRCWEGQLNMTIPGQAAPEQWVFSVLPEDTAAVDKVKAAMRARSPFELSYRQYLRVPTEHGGCVEIPKMGTTYAVYDATPIAPAAMGPEGPSVILK